MEATTFQGANAAPLAMLVYPLTGNNETGTAAEGRFQLLRFLMESARSPSRFP